MLGTVTSKDVFERGFSFCRGFFSRQASGDGKASDFCDSKFPAVFGTDSSSVQGRPNGQVL